MPPTSTTRTFLFMSDGPDAFGACLAVASRLSPKTLEDALLFWFCRRAGWPAFHYFKGDKPEEHLPRRFQIESQVLRNLLYRAAAIELRRELRLIWSQLQFLDTLEAVFCISWNRRRFEVGGLIDILNKAQGFQRPVADIRLPRHIGSIRQSSAFFSNMIHTRGAAQSCEKSFCPYCCISSNANSRPIDSSRARVRTNGVPVSLC